ncbi:MAG TPA: hypothetical protein VI141_03420 [Acidimicrobiia bacterium]
MEPATTLALDGGYWLAGVLTVIAAAIVTVVILVSSRSDDSL